MMEKQFDLLRATRHNFLKILDQSTPTSLLAIPDGFNNNILWNILHTLASQQLLVYGLSNTPFRLDKAFIFQYKSGTQPSDELDESMIDFARTHLISSVDQLTADFRQHIFGPYREAKLSYGLEIHSFEDAIHFNNLHEAMHYGQIKTYQKLLGL